MPEAYIVGTLGDAIDGDHSSMDRFAAGPYAEAGNSSV
jgi:hypothetical protein